ncbi:MAG: hypothetical protein K2X47_05485 [Bdellovibrionales bacterium]|nr:hypothetical protein [Bdellovibrionales bacterium]
MGRLSLAVAFFLGLIATAGCSRLTPDSGGGIDSSGIPRTPAIDTLPDATAKAAQNLNLLAERIQTFVNEDENHEINILVPLVRGSAHFPKPLVQFLKTDRPFTWHLSNSPCNTDSGDSDSSISSQRDICLSRVALETFPKASVHQRISALFLKEISRLYGYSEIQATSVQQLLLNQEFYFWPDECRKANCL